jgi:2'-5' RNA ligase
VGTVVVVRLFIAVWPSPAVVELLAALDRPAHPSVRWTAPEAWHVTLRFLGEVDEAGAAAATEAVRVVGPRAAPCEAVMGPATTRLNRSILTVPVAGLDDLAAAVIDATRDLGEPPGERPFSGHVTLARGRGRRPVPPSLAGRAVAATWPVHEVTVVRSHLDGGGPRYATLAAVPLAGSPGAPPDGEG